MKLLRTILAALALVLFSAAPQAAMAPITEQIAFASVRKVVVGEAPFQGACSAVVISPGAAYTAKHCLREVLTVDGLPVTEAYSVPNKDLGLLTVPGLRCPCTKFRKVAPQRGDKLFAVGFPVGLGKVVTRGEANGRATYQNEPYLVSTIPVAPGMSGGGVFSADGRLVGIVSRGYTGVVLLYVEI